MADPIVFRYLWSDDESLIAIRWHNRILYRRDCRRLLWALAITCGLIGMTIVWFGGPQWTVWIAVPVCVSLLLWHPFNDWRTNKSTTIVNLFEPPVLEWRIDSDSLRCVSSDSTTEEKWEAFFEVVETPDGFLLYNEPHMFTWISARGAQSPIDRARFSDLAKEKVGVYRRFTSLSGRESRVT